MIWNLVIRCAGPSLALVSVYGPQVELEARSQLALAWGDYVEYLGPKLGIEQAPKDFASISDLKDSLKKSQHNSRH